MVEVKFENIDCKMGFKNLKNVSCVLTSPPYNLSKQYDTYKDNLTRAEYEKFTLEWLGAAKSAMNEDSRIIINIPTVTQFDGQYEFLYPLFVSWLQQAGFHHFEEITWVKVSELQKTDSYRSSGNTGWGSFASPSSPFCRSIKEHILVAHNGSRKKVGAKENIDITNEEFVNWTHDAWALLGKSHPTHPAIWPEEIPHRLMKMYTYKGDLIVDPFVGCGTSGIVAFKLNRNFIGFDISQNYIKMANGELKKLKEQKTLLNYETKPLYTQKTI